MDYPIPQPAFPGSRQRRFGPFAAVGLALFVLSFVLPSVSQHSGGIDDGKGYQCAVLAFIKSRDALRDDLLSGICLVWADLANLLIVVWLVLMLRGSRIALRRWIVAAALVGSIPCALSFMLSNEMAPLVGYFAWVASMAIMSAPEWRRPRQTETEPAPGQPRASI